MADLRKCCNCLQVHSNLRRCSRCYSVYYCSKGCQAMHWPVHKTSCKTSLDRSTSTEAKTKIELSENEKNIDGEITSTIKDVTLTKEATDICRFEEVDEVMNNARDNDINVTGSNIKSISGVQTADEDNVTESSNGTNSVNESCRRAEVLSETLDEADNVNKSPTEAENVSKNLCEFCSRQGCSQKCSRCKESFYCSKQCQREDWPKHKDTCVKKLTEEEDRIKKLHEKMTEDKERYMQHQKSKSEFKNVLSFTQTNFHGPFERLYETLTLDQALLLASRPARSLEKAVRMTRIFFPRYDVVTAFDDIPSEPLFPISPLSVPPRRTYVLVAFMYRYHEHVMRHGVYLKDAFDKDSKVEFYFDHLGDDPSPFFSYSQVKPGGYICLVNPVMHLFGDESVGIRINNPKEVKVLDIEMVMQ